MPSSHHLQLNELVDTILKLNPKSVLDIGVGFGKYGVLIREYLDPDIGQGDQSRQIRIDGIEIFPPYITPLHSYIYDHIYMGNALEILPSLSNTYDLILLIDVLEHFDSQQGAQLITHSLDKCKIIIISTPHNPGHQTEVYGNTAERHIKRWTIRDLRNFGKVQVVPNLFSLICILSPMNNTTLPGTTFKRNVIEWFYRRMMYVYYH